VLDNPPYALALADGLLFAGGAFRNVNGRFRTGLGAVDPATGALDAWAPQADDEVLALASSADAGLLVGGRFHRMESAPGTPYLAAFALRPATPAAPVATAGDGRATVTPGALPSGGAPIESITATASPGGRSVSGPPGPLVVDGLANGTSYTFTVTATNRVGTSSSSAPSGAVTPAGGGRDAIAPVIGGLRLSNRRFAVGARSTPRIAARKTKRGTTFRFTLSEPATTRITIARARPGRRQGRRCVKPRKRLKRACMRFTTAGALTRAGAAGANRIDYSGRIGKRKLKRGRYRATLVATDAAGNASPPARVTFRVVAR
jgi:hypothetical protein